MQKRSFYQDRLGTNIGKPLKKTGVSLGRPPPETYQTGRFQHLDRDYDDDGQQLQRQRSSGQQDRGHKAVAQAEARELRCVSTCFLEPFDAQNDAFTKTG